MGELLLRDDDTHFLDEIEADYPNDIRTRCSKMFNIWQETRPDATLDQLCYALRNNKLRTAEQSIKETLYKGIHIGHVVDYI